jgi:hypothetical protein
MSASLPPRLSRLAALALLLLIVALLAVGLIGPLVGHVAELRAEIGRQRELLGRFTAYASNEQAAEAEAARSNRIRTSGIFLAGETEALLTASLQAQVRGIAEAHGVRLASARGAPPQEQDGLRLIGVQAEMEADLRQLQAILLAIEESRPHLFLQSVQVAPVGGYRAQQDTLRIRLGIAGGSLAEAEAKP